MVEYFSTIRWDGAVDLSWYNGTDTEFTITTARQLAGVAELVNSNAADFAGKIIVPFATSGGSGLGKAPERMASLTPDATVLPGKLLNGGPSDTTLRTWIENL